MSLGETFPDPVAAFDLLNLAIKQYPNHQPDPKSRRRFLGYHGRLMSELLESCDIASLHLSYKNGNSKLRQYAVDMAADGLPKPYPELGKVLDPGGTFPIVHAVEAAPVSAGLYREYFFGCPGMSTDPQRPSRMFSFGEMMEATQSGGHLMIK